MNKIFEYYLVAKEDSATLKSNNNRLKEIKTSSGISFYLIRNKYYERYEVCISVLDPLETNKLPRWDGIEFKNENRIIIDGNEYPGNFFHIIPIKSSNKFEKYLVEDDKIFVTIIADLYDALDSCLVCDENIQINKKLKFWDDFFKKHPTIVLSKDEQQGLFGELLFLKSLINHFSGTIAVNSWNGPHSKDHDFGIHGKNFGLGVEVKTSRRGSPYEIEINNEYQLLTDQNGNADTSNKLFLIFYPLEENASEGLHLPELIDSIRIQLSLEDSDLINCFDEKLKCAGYIDSFSEEYKYAFRKRDSPQYYNVTSDFPHISRQKNHISDAIGAIKYALNLAACDMYRISEEDLIKVISEVKHG